jgi:ABC-2 type transport system ATP-binding protein
MGLLQADAGELRVLDMDPLRDADRVRRRFGYVPDTPDAPRWMTTNELFGFLAPQYPAWDAACAERLAARFDIPLHTPFRALSRGQGAKAMLVAALAPSPELVLLDEPFSGLDPVARRELLQVFIEELHRLGAAALVATHDLEVAARIADHVLVLDKGRLAAAGPVDMVLGKPDEESARVPARLFDLLKGLTPGREEVAA